MHTFKFKTKGDGDHDAVSFMLQASEDNIKWVKSGEKTVTTGESTWQNFEGFTAAGKFLKFTITGTGTGDQPYIREISFSGYPQGKLT